jgi:hypothetical protein
VFQFQSDGRVRPEIQNTIGYFATILYLRVELLRDDSFARMTDRIKNEYFRAYENVEFSSVAIDLPPPELTRNTGFNWLIEDTNDGFSVPNGSNPPISCSPVPFDPPMIGDVEVDSEPSIALADSHDEIVGHMYFPLNRFSAEKVEEFARGFVEFMSVLVENPEARIAGLPLI